MQSRSLTQLSVAQSLGPSVAVSMDELDGFVVEHPLVVKLNLTNYRFAGEVAINFIRQMKALKRFALIVTDRTECDRILA